MDLKVRPIRHLENRVRAHIFLCMLAYYVEWHMLEAWRPVLFSDEDQNAKASRDPDRPSVRRPLFEKFQKAGGLTVSQSYGKGLGSTTADMSKAAKGLRPPQNNHVVFPLPNLLKQSRKQPSRGQELQSSARGPYSQGRSSGPPHSVARDLLNPRCWIAAEYSTDPMPRLR